MTGPPASRWIRARAWLRLGVAFPCVVAAGPVLATGGPAAGITQEQPTPLRPLVTAVHVHSPMSTGSLSLDELAERAARLGIEAVVLSENFALRYEYGLPPLRGVLRSRVTVPSVLASRADAFLREIAAAQARHPAVLLVPGVEVAPYYYWTGSLLSGDLRMHDSQRNLLVLGLTEPEDYAALPATGNTASHGYGWRSVGSLTPALLFIPTVWFWRRGGSGRCAGRSRKILGTVPALLGAVLLVNAWPFTQPAFSPYDADLGYTPYQALIDAGTARGAAVVWSLPEARDHHEYAFGPLGTVTVQTHPHPDALLETTGYTGFGGVYQDTRHAADPGGVWDQALGQYLAGRRRPFPVLLGEIAFHAPGQAGIELHHVLNVLRVRDRSVEGVLDAIRHGRLYAVGQYPQGAALRLTRFSLENVLNGRRGEAGDVLSIAEPTTLRVDVLVDAVDGRAHPISVDLIRSGAIIASARGDTPFRYQHFEKIENSVKGLFYRVEIKGRDAEILSNPVFAVPASGGP